MILAPATFDLGVVLQPDELCSEAPPGSIAAFEDAILESIVRLELALGPLDDLTCDLLSSLTDVDARDLGIASVVGVQNLTSLTELYLSDNSISDISALSGLTGLTTLGLEENTITDISALSGAHEPAPPRARQKHQPQQHSASPRQPGARSDG